MDDVMFSHNGAYGTESKTTPNVSSSSSGGGTGNEMAIYDYDCRLVLLLQASLSTQQVSGDVQRRIQDLQKVVMGSSLVGSYTGGTP